MATVAAGAAPELLLADLSLQHAVRALVLEVRRRVARIDVLINNAGGIFARRELTQDGMEKTFATNHLGPILLTNLVADLRSADGRILVVASETYASKLAFDNLQGEKRYGFLSAYFRSILRTSSRLRSGAATCRYGRNGQLRQPGAEPHPVRRQHDRTRRAVPTPREAPVSKCQKGSARSSISPLRLT